MTIFGMSLGWFLVCLLYFGGVSAVVLRGIYRIVKKLVWRGNPWHPYMPPLLVVDIDISDMRQPRVEDLIDEYLIEYGLADVDSFRETLENWIEQNPPPVRGIWLRGRIERYNTAIEFANKYYFRFVCGNTPRVVDNSVSKYWEPYIDCCRTGVLLLPDCSVSYKTLQARYARLATIDFECTLRQYNEKNQRKLMTKKLREEIMERDNYTCQCCGKYMPDTVGLQIDHIVPVSKGGKSVPSNLQVLCSVCNAKKSDKF